MSKAIALDADYKLCDEMDLVKYLHFQLPKVTGPLILPVITKGSREGTGAWSWNGDFEKVTLKPSIKTWYVNEEGVELVAHVFVNDGKAKFLEDSTCELVGETANLEEV